MLHLNSRWLTGLAALSACLLFSGCAGAVTQWMVNLRSSQGDTALANGSLTEAQKEYDLALKLDPHNAHARAGLATVLLQEARDYFTGSKLDLAAAAVGEAMHYAPGDAAAEALSSQIEQAKIRREIVLANYPLYESVEASLSDSLKTLTVTQHEIAKQLKLFGSDFDTGHLTRAITASYGLEDEAHRTTQRIISYRSLVSSGATKGQARAPSQTETPNLLPVP